MQNLDQLKQDLCEIGRRVYARNFVAANEGNLSTRVDENRVLCTPTLHCKGFMEPDDLCVVDLQGNQLEGKRKRTSEVLLHLEIYKQRQDINSVVHCHPPHVTAFAVAREPIPNGVLPEPDIFLGEIPIAGYETPGSQSFADTILPFVKKTNLIVLANHGTVSFDAELEKAFWFTEILDAYCRVLILAKQLGRVEYLPIAKVRDLLALRKEWGFQDQRTESAADSGIVEFKQFRAGWEAENIRQRAFAPHPAASTTSESEDSPQIELSQRQLERLAQLVAKELGKN